MEKVRKFNYPIKYPQCLFYIYIYSTKTLKNENEQAKSLAVYTKNLTMSPSRKKISVAASPH